MKINLLKRNRINQLLSGVYNYPLTVLEAPMGFGKTVAVKSFLEEEKVKSIWITFQNSGEKVDYWNLFVDKVRKLNIKGADTIINYRYPYKSFQSDEVISLLRSIKLKEKLVVVLDNYQNVNNSQLHKYITQISEENHDEIYIIIITRVITNLHLDELVSKGLCQIISHAALRFTGDEVSKYCAKVDKSITERDKIKLASYSNGWISMIYMLLIGIKQGIPIGLNRNIIDLIDQTLFQAYHPSIQNFLIKLSVVDGFTEELAYIITKDKNADKILLKLKNDNAFIFYDDLNRKYCVYSILLDFLRMKQNFLEGEKSKLYLTAGEWYLEREDFLKAYEYFFNAEEPERILIHLNSQNNTRIQLSGFRNYFEMFRKMPQELLDQYPIAYLKLLLLCLTRNKNMAAECNRQLLRLEQIYKAREDVTEEYKNRIMAEITMTRMFLTFNRTDMITNVDGVSKLLKEDKSIIFSGDNDITLEAPLLLYNYYHEKGSFQRVTQLAIEKISAFTKYMNGCSYGADYLARAVYELETGNWHDAELNSLRAIYKAGMKNQYGIILSGSFCLMRLYVFQGKVKEAIDILEKLENDAIASEYVNHVNYDIMRDIFKGYIYGCLGQLDKIPDWLREGDISAEYLFRQGIALSIITHCMAVVLSKNSIRLEMLCESFPECFSIYSNQMGIIYNDIFEAIAKYQLYGSEAGVNSLSKALVKGETDGIIMPFIENAYHIYDMLNIISQKSKSKFIQKIFRYSKQYYNIVKNNTKSIIVLTQREKEVLTLAASGMKREEIAIKLFISQGTVKTHLQNIYQKMEVNGKSAAIKMALQMGLIN